MNKIFLIGNLTRDPELNTTPNGISVCKFGIAVSRAFANASGERETDFFNVSAWRALGENCAKYLLKGKKVAVVGRLEARMYDDRDGNKRISLDVIADDVEFLSPRNEAEGSSSRPQTELKPVESDDLPF